MSQSTSKQSNTILATAVVIAGGLGMAGPVAARSAEDATALDGQPAVILTAEAASPSAAEAAVAAQPVRRTPAGFSAINHEEDYSGLADPSQRTGLWEKLKYIPLGGDAWLSLGGEVRLRPEYRENQRFGQTAQDDDGDYEQRTRLWAELHPTAHVRAFLELQSSSTGALKGLRTITDDSRTDVHQAFVEIEGQAGDVGLSLRAGRQEIGLGGYRLFDMRDASNTRRALDLVRATATGRDWSVSGFAGYALRESIPSFDDASNRDYEIQGLDAWRQFGSDGPRIEGLYVHSNRGAAKFSELAAAQDDRHTLSLRISGKRGPWDYEAEAIGQTGDYGTLDARAWYLTGGLGRQFAGAWAPRLSVRIDAASGDKDPNDGKLNTYNTLFARPLTYNGDLNYANLIMVQPTLTLKPKPKWTLDLITAGLWRESIEDTVYYSSGAPFMAGSASDARYVGWRNAVSSRYALNRFTTLGLYANYTFAGTVLKDGGLEDQVHLAGYVTFRF